MLADGNKALSSGEESAAVATKVCIFNIKKIKGCDDSSLITFSLFNRNLSDWKDTRQSSQHHRPQGWRHLIGFSSNSHAVETSENQIHAENITKVAL